MSKFRKSKIRKVFIKMLASFCVFLKCIQWGTVMVLAMLDLHLKVHASVGQAVILDMHNWSAGSAKCKSVFVRI